MSRSFHKHPFIGICSDSDKLYKQKTNRSFRRAEALALVKWEDQEPPLNKNQVSNPWFFAKEGKMRVAFREDCPFELEDFRRWMKK